MAQLFDVDVDLLGHKLKNAVLESVTLPVATEDEAGAVKVGDGLSINEQAILSIDLNTAENNGIKLGLDATGKVALTVTSGTIVSGETKFVTGDAVADNLDLKVDKVTGKQLSTEDFTSELKTKLDGIEAEANKYILPKASTTELGGIKVGDNVSVDADGKLSADVSTQFVTESIANAIDPFKVKTVDNTATANGINLILDIDGKLDVTSEPGEVVDGNNKFITGDAVYEYVKAQTDPINAKFASAVSPTNQAIDKNYVDTTFAQESHVHEISDVTGLESALEELDGKVSKVFHYKGTKATKAELPLSGNAVGDVWFVTEANSEFAWPLEVATGTLSDWVELGSIVDLSNYVTKDLFATAANAGVVKVGDNLSITVDGKLSADVSTEFVTDRIAEAVADLDVKNVDTAVKKGINLTLTDGNVGINVIEGAIAANEDKFVSGGVIKTALDGKSDTGHTHEISEVNGLQAALDGKVDKTQLATTGATGIVKIGEGISVATDGTISADIQPSLVEITYSELVAKVAASGLIPGQQYRITDYVTTTTQAGTQSEAHPFDIIVTADSVNKLNEVARAIDHSGETYFNNSVLSSWELKYSLENKLWSDTANGKGTIYWLKDQNGNEAPYDFKNIKIAFEGGEAAFGTAFGVNGYVFALQDSHNNIIKGLRSTIPYIVFGGVDNSSVEADSNYIILKGHGGHNMRIESFCNHVGIMGGSDVLVGSSCENVSFGTAPEGYVVNDSWKSIILDSFVRNVSVVSENTSPKNFIHLHHGIDGTKANQNSVIVINDADNAYPIDFFAPDAMVRHNEVA